MGDIYLSIVLLFPSHLSQNQQYLLWQDMAHTFDNLDYYTRQHTIRSQLLKLLRNKTDFLFPAIFFCSRSEFRNFSNILEYLSQKSRLDFFNSDENCKFST